MSNKLLPEKREVIRIRVKKCDGMLQPEYKKLCVDPQLTSFEMLQNLLARAFDITGDFAISYLAKDELGFDAYLSLLSDWDLDAAFFSASDPYLRLKVDLKPFEEGLDDWDIIAPVEVPAKRGGASLLSDRNYLLGTLSGLTTQVGKTVSQVSKAIGLKNEDGSEQVALQKLPMSDAEFHSFLDPVGHLIQPQLFRMFVYRGGVEASLRRVVWRHLLNVFPEELNGKERFDYFRCKVDEYHSLRDRWREQFQKTEELHMIINMVKKDVLRTDRTLPFFAGSDESQNVVALFNILVTYAFSHPEVSYCQGMSDLASPLLFVQGEEAAAYICFCGLMSRVKTNFSPSGDVMMTKFNHLLLLLQHHDPVFCAYLKEHKADDLFFCYRWLLLELKREFPFEDTLQMLEVTWSSLPPDPPEKELELAEPGFSEHGFTCSPNSPVFVNPAYMKLQCHRRHSGMAETTVASKVRVSNLQPESDLVNGDRGGISPCEDVKAMNASDYLPIYDSDTAALESKSNSIDVSLVTDCQMNPTEHYDIEINPLHLSMGGIDVTDGFLENDIIGEQADRSAPLTCSAESATAIDTEEIIPNHSISDCYTDANPGSFNGSVETPLLCDGEPSHADNQSDVARENKCSSDAGTSEIREGISKTPSQISLRDEEPRSPKRPVSIDVKETYNVMANYMTGLDPNTHLTLELNSCEEASENQSLEIVDPGMKLPDIPPPSEFGAGNPFLMFLCLTLLLQHRDRIMSNNMDYNDLAMHFDKMVRKHDVTRVLSQAQSLYSAYLRSQQETKVVKEDDVISPVSYSH